MPALRAALGLTAIVLTGALGIAPALASVDPECPLQRAASLALTEDIGGRPLIPVRVEGRDKLFLVDTGGIYTMLTHATAQELSLATNPTRPGSFVFVNGDTAAATARARSFRIGGLPLGEFTFLVTPASIRLPGAAGALGPDIMRQFDVELDFAKNRINFFAQNHCQGGVVYWTNRPHAELAFTMDESWHITAPGMLDTKIVDILIDTGAVATNMMLEDAMQEFGVATNSPGVERIDEAVYRYRFKTLDIEGVTIERPNIVIRPDRTGLRAAGLRPELILGMSELRKLHLYIAYRERKIYITGADDR